MTAAVVPVPVEERLQSWVAGKRRELTIAQAKARRNERAQLRSAHRAQ